MDAGAVEGVGSFSQVAHDFNSHFTSLICHVCCHSSMRDLGRNVVLNGPRGGELRHLKLARFEQAVLRSSVEIRIFGLCCIASTELRHGGGQDNATSIHIFQLTRRSSCERQVQSM